MQHNEKPKLTREDYIKILINSSVAITSGYANCKNYYTRGCAFFKLNKVDEAIVDYNEAIRLDPTFVNAYINCTHAYFKKNNFPAAIQRCLQAIKLDPTDSLARNNLMGILTTIQSIDDLRGIDKKSLREGITKLDQKNQMTILSDCSNKNTLLGQFFLGPQHALTFTLNSMVDENHKVRTEEKNERSNNSIYEL